MVILKNFIRCEAAGRKYNEDNGKILQLRDNKGVLLIVCDGMGGMKAGEVASALAVDTIKEWFTPERLTPQVMSNPMEYLKQSIVGADTNIKNYSKTHPETEGMGSTVVLAWLLREKVYVAWCGDSRAYRYNPQLGLERLSHDHSLVQSWVDAGQITEEQAFTHPQSNIITRSLGDPNGVAMPDAAEYILYNNDVYLLCSDGLCGMLRDSEIEVILSENNDLTQACEQLWQAAEEAGWHDNVTTAMAQVVSGGSMLSTAQPEKSEPQELEIMDSPSTQEKRSWNVARLLMYACIVILLLCAAILAHIYFSQEQKPEQLQEQKQDIESPANPSGSPQGIVKKEASTSDSMQNPSEEINTATNQENAASVSTNQSLPQTQKDSISPRVGANATTGKESHHTTPAVKTPDGNEQKGTEPTQKVNQESVDKEHSDTEGRTSSN